MRIHHSPLRNKHRNIISLIVILIALASVTPALAEYKGPVRTVTQTVTSCQVVLFECQDVPSKGWKYHRVDDWSCSNESKPWRDYSSEPSALGCSLATNEHTYWERVYEQNAATTTYPPATISGTLQNCTLNNGWCITSPQLYLSGNEPVSGYSIDFIEGTQNDRLFACSGASCNVSLLEGNNYFTYWAHSTFTDTSTMGTLSAKVDSQPPTITGTLNGTAGSNGWYTGPVTFNGSAGDTISGLASFTCSLDGAALGSCSTINMSGEGPHTLVLTARDNAGHTRTLTQNTSIDSQPPVLSATISGTRGSNNWYTAAALNGSASDPSPGSGLLVFEYALDGGSWTVFPSSGISTFSDGSHTVSLRATDTAGHIVSTSRTFSLDSVAPAVAIEPTGTLGANGWYIADLRLAASATDDTSGVDVLEYSHNNDTWTTYTTPLVLPDGSHRLSFWAEDEAGLVTQISQTYKVDSRPPQISGELSGIPGENGWFISDVALAASTSDPAPGSGIDALTYLLNDDPETSYTDPLTLSNGQHTIRFNAMDNAGLSYSMEETVKVDTILPSLTVQTTLSGWIKDSVTLKGTSGDGDSGLSKVEISIDGGQSWQPVDGDTSWSFPWNTVDNPNGLYEVQVRATDNAGLATTRSLKTGVDNQAPSISLPDSWFQWETVELNIQDDYSGLSEARLEIVDPENRWPARIVQLNPNLFPLQIEWDRRFGDDTIAPAGTYTVHVTATDKLGHSTSKTASIKVLLGILPPGPTATPQPTTRPPSTPIPVFTATALPSSTATQAVVVRPFGSTLVPQPSITPVSTNVTTPRATPTQSNVTDWLESVLVPNSNASESAIEIASLEEPETSSTSSSPARSNVVWGAAAAAMVGAMTSYALEEKRKQEEEKARQAAEQVEERERRMKARERKMDKLEEQWAQERAWEQAREEEEQKKEFIRQVLNDRILARSNEHLLQEEAEEGAKWYAAQEAIRQRDRDKKLAEEEKKKAEDLQAGLEAYYNARKQGEATVAEPPKEKSQWDKALDWIDDHQNEIALGIGVAVGIGAIIASGGVATPFVAAAWVAGSAVVAGGQLP